MIPTIGRRRRNWAAGAAATLLLGSAVFVTNGPMLDLRVDTAVAGDTIQAKVGQQLRVRARAWGHPKMGAPRLLEIVRFGNVLRSASASEEPDANPDTSQLELDVPIEVRRQSRHQSDTRRSSSSDPGSTPGERN